MRDMETYEKMNKAYFLRNTEWYERIEFDEDKDLEEGREEDCPYPAWIRLTEKAPKEAIASFNHCFDISPDGKPIIPYFMTNTAWFGVNEDYMARGRYGVFYLKDAAPPEAVHSYHNYYAVFGGLSKDVIPYYMLDESWYERDENGSVARLTSKAPYLARASFADHMHPCAVSW